MKVGIIGLGDIATKAYLPVMARKHLEIHLYTRDENKLRELSSQYRFQHRHASLEAIMDSGIQAAFVHTATASHEDIVQQLLERKIHVYVDKPVTYNYISTERLVALAEKKQVMLMAGFNRRFAPAYVTLRQLSGVNMILMQKNRNALPGDIRAFVFDDFIHVIDTLLFLFPDKPGKITVTGRKSEGFLYHVVLQFQAANGATAIGIMNRDSGTVEERLEVFTSSEKWVVNNLVDTTVLKDSHALRHRTGDWESTLSKRGFEQITAYFLQAAASGQWPSQAQRDLLRTHQVCEQVVAALLSPGNDVQFI